jgi:hypothetical protein
MPSSDFTVAWHFSQRKQLVFSLRIKLHTTRNVFIHLG